MSFILQQIIQPPLTAGGVVYGTGSSAAVTAAGTAGQVLVSAGTGAPVFTTGSIIPAPLTAGGVVYGTGTGAAVSAVGTAGQVLTSTGAGAPVFATPVPGGSTLLFTAYSLPLTTQS